MLTIFTIPKAFKGNIRLIQRNAIQSWLKIDPEDEIILFGDDEGVAETAREFNILHVANIEKTELGTPLLSSAIDTAQKMAKNQILIYLNADIILTSDLISAIKQLKEPLFLMSGQRWDLNVDKEIDFNDSDWEDKLKEKAYKTGKLHGPKGMDYFIFPRNFPDIIKMPAFAVGRPGWDNWLIYRTRFLKIPMIDATEAMTIIHQNHDYSHSTFGKKGRVSGPEFKKNINLAGGFINMMTLRESNWILTKNGLIKPEFPVSIFADLALFYPWRFVLFIKRRIRCSMGK